jgi:hypothetical protein
MAERDNDTVQLTDLEVIQQFSLAVRGATATRREVIDALEADLAFLTSRRPAAAPKPAPAAEAPVTKAPLKKAAPAKKAPAKKATRASRG